MTLEAKRDQRAYDLIQGHISGLILATILRIVLELDDPYEARPGLGGMTAYPPRIMAVVCIIRDAEQKTFRRTSDYLRASPDLRRKLGLAGRIPSSSTISRSYSMIPERYLYEIHRRVLSDLEARGGPAAGDSTGIAERRTDKWMDFRTDKVRHRKGWPKLHAIIDVNSRVILDYFVTRSRVADISGMRTMLERFGPCVGPDGMDFCLDSAYLAREMCSLLAELGFAPYIKPKKNTCRNARGSQSWRVMVDLYRDDLPEFKRHYHQRSIIEAVFGAVKTMYGSYVRCRRKDNQRREVAARVICYNIELIARFNAERGRLTRQSLAAITA